MDAVTAPIVIVICLIVKALPLKSLVTMAMPPGGVGIMGHQAVNHLPLGSKERVGAVQPEGVPGAAPGKWMHEYKASFVAICLQGFVKCLQVTLIKRLNAAAYAGPGHLGDHDKYIVALADGVE